MVALFHMRAMATLGNEALLKRNLKAGFKCIELFNCAVLILDPLYRQGRDFYIGDKLLDIPIQKFG